MRRSLVVQVSMLALLVGGCSPSAGESPPASASAPVSQRSAVPTGTARVGERVSLPSGFPVLPRAVAVAIPEDDPELIGLWSSDQQGSVAYDFYTTALPAAGYRIVGLYPGGAVAVIRFGLPGGAVWQMVAHGSGDDTVTIEIRLDRP